MKKNLLTLLLNFLCIISVAQTNYALSLNGTSDYVTIGAPLTTNGSYTKEAWVYQTATAGSQNIISSPNAPFWISGGILSAGQAGNFSLVADAVTFPLNIWVHVAVTYDAATTTLKLYKNGALISTNSSVPAYTSENTFISSHQGLSSFFQGRIDEVRIWNVAISQAQLKRDIYSGPPVNAPGLVAYYNCNDGAGTVLTSSCTNTTGLNGTLQSTATWVLSPVQYGANAISFDGVNDAVNIPDNNNLHITSSITLEAWVYAVKNSGIQNVISKSTNSPNTGYIFPRTDDGWGHAIIYLHIGSWQTLSAVYPSLNAWHHLAATYDGATMKLYIDGTLAASRAQAGAITSNSNPLTLGNQPGYLEFFGGSADEFRVWNVARTQTEIQNNMNTELNPATQTGLVSYYTADQGIIGGTNTGLASLIDLSNSNNGTLGNFALSGGSSNFVSQFSTLAILPVSLISFAAQKNDHSVTLTWSTASEQNTKDFTIQHSTNGNAWDNIGVVTAAGNSTTIREYGYEDINPANGINYYRLLQKDIDGRGSYSNVLSVKYSADNTSFIILNNPVTNGVLQVKLNKPSPLSLYNSEGKLLWKKHVNVGTETINVNGYAKGTYFLKAGEMTRKVMVQN